MGITIKDGIKQRCPHCQNVYATINDDEILYNKIYLVHIKGPVHTIKCKNCGEIVTLNVNNKNIA
jgi:hypothetical protein